MLPAVAFFLLTAAAPAPPRRVVSLDLCADELALALAAPAQLASVSRLGADLAETRLAPLARGVHRNSGRVEAVAHLRPDLVLTTGGTGQYGAELAARLGARVLALPPPQTTKDVRANVRRASAALGREAAGAAMLARFDRDLGPGGAPTASALLLGAGGVTPRADGLAAAYLARAGLRQAADGRVDLERLVATPPAVLVLSTYRAGQASLGQQWLRHPALERLPSRRVTVDGRGWTCLGPEAARTLPGLRAVVAAARPAASPSTTPAFAGAVPLPALRAGRN